MSYRLNWYGAVNGQSGYEYLTRGMLIALDKLGVTVSLKNLNWWNKENVAITRDKAGRFERMAKYPFFEDAPVVVMQKIHDDMPICKNDMYIYSLFETDKIPESWIKGFKKAKKVFVFSKFNYENWGKQIDNVSRVGFGIEDNFRYVEEAANILNKKGYTFLSVGDYTERKGFDILLDAYCEEFTARDSVTLILKIHKGGFTSPHRDNLMMDLKNQISKYKNIPRILLFAEKVYYEDLTRLYNACDCFVLPSRGEGIGLPVAEAMACGLPVIVSDSGGYMDFVRHGENGLTIKTKMVTIADVNYILKCPHALGHKWAEPDKQNLKEAMRYVFENRQEAKEMGRNGVTAVRDFHWNDVAVQLLKEIFC